jgi:IS30 family transposase
LGRSPNTISLEIKTNSVAGEYNARKAKLKARLSRKSRRFQWQKIEQQPQLRAFVIAKLEEDWSPDAIAGYLREQQAELPTIGKDQLYAWLYSARGQPYCHHLLSKRYHPKKRPDKKSERVMIPNRVSITERPAIVGARARSGDWEGDTVVSGKRTGGKAALAVTHERTSKLLAACLIPNLKPESFTRAAIAMLGGKQAHTLSLDNGIENKQWQGITDATGVDVFFCDAYSSWQKGGVENGNKMLRRYLPKGCDLGNYTQPQVDDYVARINNKPRRCLGYKSALQYANEKGIYLNGLVS